MQIVKVGSWLDLIYSLIHLLCFISKSHYAHFNFKFFSQILELARNITGLDDTAAAIKQFRAKLSSQEMYFNKRPFPANESNPEAYARCNNLDGAKRFCPRRWEALQRWFKMSREV